MANRSKKNTSRADVSRIYLFLSILDILGVLGSVRTVRVSLVRKECNA